MISCASSRANTVRSFILTVSLPLSASSKTNTLSSTPVCACRGISGLTFASGDPVHFVNTNACEVYVLMVDVKLGCSGEENWRTSEPSFTLIQYAMIVYGASL